MDREQAAIVLTQALQAYRAMTYRELADSVGRLDAFEVVGADGKAYQLEIQVIWDGRPGKDVRVLGAVDDGGWSAFSPLGEDFMRKADET